MSTSTIPPSSSKSSFSILTVVLFNKKQRLGSNVSISEEWSLISESMLLLLVSRSQMSTSISLSLLLGVKTSAETVSKLLPTITSLEVLLAEPISKVLLLTVQFLLAPWKAVVRAQLVFSMTDLADNSFVCPLLLPISWIFTSRGVPSFNWSTVTLDDPTTELWFWEESLFFFFILNLVWLVWSQCSDFFFFFFFFGFWSAISLATSPMLSLTWIEELSALPCPAECFSLLAKTLTFDPRSCCPGISSSSPKSGTVSEQSREISNSEFGECSSVLSTFPQTPVCPKEEESSPGSKTLSTNGVSFLDGSEASLGFAAKLLVDAPGFFFVGFFFEAFGFFLLGGPSTSELLPSCFPEYPAFLFCPTSTLTAANFASLCSMWASSCARDAKDKKANPPIRSKSGWTFTFLDELAGDLPFNPVAGK